VKGFFLSCQGISIFFPPRSPYAASPCWPALLFFQLKYLPLLFIILSCWFSFISPEVITFPPPNGKEVLNFLPRGGPLFLIQAFCKRRLLRRYGLSRPAYPPFFLFEGRSLRRQVPVKCSRYHSSASLFSTNSCLSGPSKSSRLYLFFFPFFIGCFPLWHLLACCFS